MLSCRHKLCFKWCLILPTSHIPEAEIIRMSNRIKTETLHQYFITRCPDYNKGFGYIDLFKPYADERLTQFNRKFRCYKFRSMKSEYSGMTPEAAFTKMGKPELIKKYRKDGDYLKDDPRITKFGKFIRKTSLDELPQLFNILKGDISLIGPRALLPGELRDYGDRSLLLTVKSGLTGFAQVSGRRNISFEERRALDIYYVMNWSLLLDAQIFFRTIAAVIKRDGAK